MASASVMSRSSIRQFRSLDGVLTRLQNTSEEAQQATESVGDGAKESAQAAELAFTKLRVEGTAMANAQRQS
jgi:hypothetical protein